MSILLCILLCNSRVLKIALRIINYLFIAALRLLDYGAKIIF